MSYFRGDPYIWEDTEHLVHIWTGYRDPPSDPKQWKSGVALSSNIVDELAVMRVAQIIEEGRIHQVIARAKLNQNAGATALRLGYLFGRKRPAKVPA